MLSLRVNCVCARVICKWILPVLFVLYHLCSYIRIFYTQCGSPSTSVSCWSKDFKRAECSCIAPKPPPAPSGPIIGGYGDFRYQYMPNLLQLPEGTEVTPRGKNHDYSLTRSLGIVIFLTHPRTHAPTHPRTHTHTHTHTLRYSMHMDSKSIHPDEFIWRTSIGTTAFKQTAQTRIVLCAGTLTAPTASIWTSGAPTFAMEPRYPSPTNVASSTYTLAPIS